MFDDCKWDLISNQLLIKPLDIIQQEVTYITGYYLLFYYFIIIFM